MQKESFLTVNNDSSYSFVIEKSKFICYLKHVESEDDARSFITEIKKKHFDATHNCSAFIADEFGQIARFSDDGEPQGTAGFPMLDVLVKRDIKEICAVVTRYFGGIKLGAGGLVRAYSSAVSMALDNADLVNKNLVQIIKVNCGFDTYSALERLNSESTKIIDREFLGSVFVTFAVLLSEVENFKKTLTETFLGKEKYEELGTRYELFKVTK